MRITKRQLKRIIRESIIKEMAMPAMASQVNDLKQARMILDPERSYDQKSKMEQQQAMERIRSEMNPRDFKIALRLADLFVEYTGTDFGYGADFSPEEEALWEEAEELGSQIGMTAQEVFR